MSDYYKKYMKYKRKYVNLKAGKFEYLHKQKEPVPIYPYFIKILDKYFDRLDDLSVLEVGIGNGLKSISRSKLFGSYVGLEPDDKLFEISTENCDRVKCKIELVHSDIDGYRTDEKYDLVILENVFHFLDPDDSLDKLIGLLRPNGVVFVDEPKAIPKRCGNSELNEYSDQFNPEKWEKKKTMLLRAKEFLMKKGTHYNLDMKDVYVIQHNKQS